MGRSAYDGRRTRVYRGRVNGRNVEVHSSWQPGDPDRDKGSGQSGQSVPQKIPFW